MNTEKLFLETSQDMKKTLEQTLSIRDSILKNDLPLVQSGWSPSAFSERAFSEKPQITTYLPRRGPGPMNYLARKYSERFTEFDETGHVKGLGTMTKSQLCDLHGLKFKDLRDFDSQVSSPSIKPHGSLFIFKVFSLRAFVKRQTLVLFDDLRPTQAASLEGTNGLDFFDRTNLLQNLKKLKQPADFVSGNPNRDRPTVYEFRVLECLLDATYHSFEAEYAYLKDVTIKILADLKTQTESHIRKLLLIHSKKNSSFIQRVKSVENCLHFLLNSETDRQNLHLSKLGDNLHQLEITLEYSLRLLEDLSSEAELNLKHISKTEEIIDLATHGINNTLTALDLRLSLLSVGVTGGALIAAIFGMNLQTNLESAPYAFIIVITFSAFMCTSGIAYGWYVLEKAIKDSSGSFPHYQLESDPAKVIEKK